MFECGRRSRRSASHLAHQARPDGRVRAVPQPGLLAKITRRLMISGGRLIWGVGAGWYDNESPATATSSARPPSGSGVARDRRDSQGAGTEPDVSYAGTQSRSTAPVRPKPLQQPHPEVLIGGGGEQLNLGSSPATPTRRTRRQARRVAAQAEVPQQHCRDVAATTTRSARRSRRGVHPRDRAEIATPGPIVLGRTVRLVAGREPRRHPRAGRREDLGYVELDAPASTPGAATTRTSRPSASSPGRRRASAEPTSCRAPRARVRCGDVRGPGDGDRRRLRPRDRFSSTCSGANSRGRAGVHERWSPQAMGRRETPGAQTGLLLAEPARRAARGRRSPGAGRVGFFLRVEAVDAVHERLVANGVQFVVEPRDEPYGRVGVFLDISGNRWDLLGPHS